MVECARMWHSFGETACRVFCRSLLWAEVALHSHTMWLMLGLGERHRAHRGLTWLAMVTWGQLVSLDWSLIKLKAWPGGAVNEGGLEAPVDL